MAASTKQVVWDAAAWIAMILDEKIRNESGAVTADRGLLARTVHRAAERGHLELVTPALALAEVCCKAGIREDEPDRVAAFFDHDYILVVPVDTVIGTTARELAMRARPSDQPLLRPNDSIYVATAVELDIAEIHTFDPKLEKLSGLFDTRSGVPIIIRNPTLESGENNLLTVVSA